MTNGEKLKQHINNMSYSELYTAFIDFEGQDFTEKFCSEYCHNPKRNPDGDCIDVCVDKFVEWCNKSI